MEVTSDNIIITASSTLGIKYAMNTYMQNDGVMQNGIIEDYPDVKERSLFLDCGRKFYSPESIKAMIKDLSWNKMNVLYLDFSNNYVFRFKLDDMNMTWADGAKSDDLSKIVSEDTLTQKDMDETIALADVYGVKIIPTLNSPGHMDWILDRYLEYKLSESTINLDNQEAHSFAVSLVKKYAEYFKSRGIDTFNISADEATQYNTTNPTFVSYVKELNTMLRDMDYQVCMFNDGIRKNMAKSIPSNITILYWDPNINANASVLEIMQTGHNLVNFAADYMYYAAGNLGAFNCSANNIYDGTWKDELHNQNDEIANNNKGWNPGEFSKMWPKQQMSFIGGEFVYPKAENVSGKLIGASYALWADHPSGLTDKKVVQDTWDKIRATAERSWRVNTDSIKEPLKDDGKGYDVEQPSTKTYEEFEKTQLSVSIAPGGFKSDGTIDVENSKLPEASDILLDEADKTMLKAMIEKAQALDSKLYTKASWEKFQNVLREAKEVFDNKTASDDEVEEAVSKLEKAMEKELLRVADYSAVDAAIAKANSLNKKEYKDFSAVEKAIAAVERDLDISRQKDVDAMADTILDAIAGLEKKDVNQTSKPNNHTNNTEEAPTTADTNSVMGYMIACISALLMTGLLYSKRK